MLVLHCHFPIGILGASQLSITQLSVIFKSSLFTKVSLIDIYLLDLLTLLIPNSNRSDSSNVYITKQIETSPFFGCWENL